VKQTIEYIVHCITRKIVLFYSILFFFLKNKQARNSRSIFEIFNQKGLTYWESIYVHIERFGMLKVKSVQLRKAELHKRSRPSVLLPLCLPDVV